MAVSPYTGTPITRRRECDCPEWVIQCVHFDGHTLRFGADAECNPRDAIWSWEHIQPCGASNRYWCGGVSRFAASASAMLREYQEAAAALIGGGE